MCPRTYFKAHTGCLLTWRSHFLSRERPNRSRFTDLWAFSTPEIWRDTVLYRCLDCRETDENPRLHGHMYIHVEAKHIGCRGSSWRLGFWRHSRFQWICLHTFAYQMPLIGLSACANWVGLFKSWLRPSTGDNKAYCQVSLIQLAPQKTQK